MADGEKISLVCDKCGKHFQCKAPSAPGGYSVNCTNPECGAKVSFRYPAGGKADSGKSNPQKDIKFGLLDNGDYRFKCDNSECGQSVLVLADNIKVGHNKALCPKCHTIHEFEIEPTEEDLLKCRTSNCDSKLAKPDSGDGVYSCTCEKCGTEYTLIVQDNKVVKVIMKTPPPIAPKRQSKMKLVLGRFLGKKEYILSKGSHYIGRLDDINHSDFAIKDKYASSRSVRIDVNENGGSLIYRLTVERAMNPVYHNSRELAVGDIVYLAYGDTLKLGKTLIKVQKVKE